jgi:RNA polymerase sigma-70 factor (ECF subfamily)
MFLAPRALAWQSVRAGKLLASNPIPGSERTSKRREMDSSASSPIGVHEDDSSLVARVRRRDGEAFAQLYDRYSRLVYSVALRVIRSASAAEDVLHDVFLQLWQAPEHFDAARGNLPSWMTVIARHRAIDRLRQQRVTVDPAETVLTSSLDISSEVELADFVERVREVLRAMPEAQRQAVEMAFFDGKTHAEIAAATKEPLGTVKTRIRSALITIRRTVQP